MSRDITPMPKPAKRPKKQRRGRIASIRRLRHGEAIPEGEPRRYRASTGYYVLRWTVAPSRLVEALEHRVVMGLPPDDMHVHHINGDRSDNRPENLAVLSAKEHAAEHASTIEADVVRMYGEGYSTIDIGKLLGCTAPHVSRLLGRNGVTMRSKADYARKGLDTAEIVRLAKVEGCAAPEIASLVGSTTAQVHNILHGAGVRRGKGSTNTKAERALRAARLAIQDRSGGSCEAGTPECTGRGQHAHHVLMRSQGGQHEPGNLLWVCLPCHHHIHANPADSYRLGYLRRRTL